MNNPELNYKKRVASALSGINWSTQFHEDKIEKYIADMSWSANFVDGWFEVKYCARAPKTLGSIDHWTIGQERWLIERGRKGAGHCYLLVGTPNMNALLAWNFLADARDAPFKQALHMAAVAEKDFKDFIWAVDRRCRMR